ncbi:DUF3130 family protein [Listeria grayi]|uniref:Uncharacterized protein n=1 Tax=Listeria grayi FSL F6-1183 TaxID=1265827 RepID=A0A829R5K3_LISGR|nr:DUF3130 family protein [Listeria grayi]EUJ27746.1 hypothetical protein LMUR_09474 [Listeria grayi FSL F6-1183]
MREIQVSEQKFQQHAARLGETSHAVRYRLKGNNLAYSRANSTNHLRTAIFDFISVVDDLQQLGQKDAQRLKKNRDRLCEARSNDRAKNRSAGGALIWI